MIISTIDNLSGKSTLDNIIKSVMAEDLATYPDGISEISGLDVFVNRIRGEARDLEDSMSEIHREYVDVHVTLSGRETIGFSVEIESLSNLAGCSFVNDCELNKRVNDEQFVTLEEGQYGVFFPLEWHRPMIKRGNFENEIDKVVIKVRASLL